jgi:uncharacterized protein (DUF2336 family)
MPPDDSLRQAENVALLRAVVVAFVARAAHPHADIRQFEQLVLGLLDLVDDAQAAAALRPLLLHPEAPAAIFRRLRARGGACAALALELQPGLTAADLAAALRAGAADLAPAAARRGDLDAAVIDALAAGGDLDTLCALAANLSARPGGRARTALLRAARLDRGLARLLLDRGDFDQDRPALFLAATRAERRAIVIDACRRARALGRADLRIAHPAIADRLEAAARRGDGPEMAAIFAHAFNCGTEQALALLADRQGEPLALALAALGVSPAAARRILSNAAALISHDARRLRGLAALVRATPQRVASQLVLAVTEEGKIESPPLLELEKSA